MLLVFNQKLSSFNYTPYTSRDDDESKREGALFQGSPRSRQQTSIAMQRRRM